MQKENIMNMIQKLHHFGFTAAIKHPMAGVKWTARNWPFLYTTNKGSETGPGYTWFVYRLMEYRWFVVSAQIPSRRLIAISGNWWTWIWTRNNWGQSKNWEFLLWPQLFWPQLFRPESSAYARVGRLQGILVKPTASGWNARRRFRPFLH